MRKRRTATVRTDWKLRCEELQDELSDAQRDVRIWTDRIEEAKQEIARLKAEGEARGKVNSFLREQLDWFKTTLQLAVLSDELKYVYSEMPKLAKEDLDPRYRPDTENLDL